MTWSDTNSFLLGWWHCWNIYTENLYLLSGIDNDDLADQIFGAEETIIYNLHTAVSADTARYNTDREDRAQLWETTHQLLMLPSPLHNKPSHYQASVWWECCMQHSERHQQRLWGGQLREVLCFHQCVHSSINQLGCKCSHRAQTERSAAALGKRSSLLLKARLYPQCKWRRLQKWLMDTRWWLFCGVQ